MSSGDIDTGPLHIFIQTLAKHVREENPTHMAIAWDSGRYGHRTTLDATYKSNRAASPEHDLRDTTFPLVREFLDLANIKHMACVGVEGDDFIANWWRTTRVFTGGAAEMVILSSDKDFLQLVGENPYGIPVQQVRLSSANAGTDRWDRYRVTGEYGVSPEKLPLLFAVMGDTSDGVVGLYGIGPKKGTKLLEKHGFDFLELTNALPEEHRERIWRNRQLVDLRQLHFDLDNEQRGWFKIPVPEFHLTMPSSTGVGPLGLDVTATWLRLEAFLQQLDMRSTLDSWPSLWRPVAPVGRSFRRLPGGTVQPSLW